MIPVIEILPETSLGDRLGQIFVRGQNDAHIDGARLASSYRFKLQLLQYSQQFHLHARRGGPDFVQEDGAAVSQFELAFLLGDRAGKGAGNVTKQFALQKLLGQSSTSDLDEWSVAPATPTVEGSGNQALSRPALAGDQNGRPRISHAVDHVEDALHAVVAADDVLQAESLVELLLEVPVFLEDAAL